jgi:hypothetical protein
MTQNTEFFHSFVPRIFTTSIFHVATVNVLFSHPSEKHDFPTADFHETHNGPAALCADILYRISPKSDNKCGKQGWKFTYKLS